MGILTAILTDDDLIQIAIDYYGAEIRDNTREFKITLGRELIDDDIKQQTNGDTNVRKD